MVAPPRGYELLHELGRGGSGSRVYLARQVSLNRLVALKNLSAQGVPDLTVAMFRDEARAVGSLRNANIVSALDFAHDANGLWLATQLVRGPDLRSLLNEVGVLSPDFALSVVLQVGAALAAAHAAGIVHRDVKPANVLVSPDGTVRLTDFGVAQISGSPTSHGIVAGTPTYMAPEQVQGKTDIDGRTDLYALALFAYEVLVGYYPFRIDRRDADAAMAAQLHEEPTDPDLLGTKLPKQTKRVVLSGLAKQRDQRPRSVAQWCTDLAGSARKAPRDWRTVAVPRAAIEALDPVHRQR